MLRREVLRTATRISARMILRQPGLTREEAAKAKAQARADWLRQAPDHIAEFDRDFAPLFDQAIHERFGTGPLN